MGTGSVLFEVGTQIFYTEESQKTSYHHIVVQWHANANFTV